MCTAATYKTDGFYFGRTLDYEFSYGDEIVVTPRRFPLAFSGGKALSEHFALLGMAHVADGYPLYYDAMNEKGLCMAGLNFVGNAAYAAPRGGEGDVAQFEFIPWVLAQCASVSEARMLLGKTNLTGTPFSAALPAAQLHWLLADKDECVTIESTADSLHVYDNPAGVLTNNPPFPQQLFRLNDYRSLSPRQPENTFAPALDLRSYSRGMGALGLPGDLSSSSRFVRGIHARERRFRLFRNGERQPVFPHSRRRGAGTRLLRGGTGQARDHDLYLLLQRAARHLLLYDLRKPPHLRRGHAPLRS